MSSDGMNAAAALWAEGFSRERGGVGEWGGGRERGSVCVRERGCALRTVYSQLYHRLKVWVPVWYVSRL